MIVFVIYFSKNKYDFLHKRFLKEEEF